MSHLGGQLRIPCLCWRQWQGTAGTASWAPFSTLLRGPALLVTSGDSPGSALAAGISNSSALLLSGDRGLCVASSTAEPLR